MTSQAVQPSAATDVAEAQTGPLYSGSCRLLDWRHGAKTGMTVDLQLRMPGPLGEHPFKGVPDGRETGQRLKLTCSRVGMSGEMENIYAGEAVLLDWSENSRLGMMARLLLDDGPDGETGRHPFFGLQHGRVTGEPIEMIAIAISDDESEAQASGVRRRTPFYQLNEVKQSQILCRDPRFRGFLRAHLERFVKDADKRAAIAMLPDRPDGFPAAVIRAALEVETRAVMNGDTPLAAKAKRRWHRMMTLWMDEVWNSKWLGSPAP